MRTLRAVSDSSNVAFATPEATVFEAMLGGWDSQQRSRGLRSTTIATRRRLILRLQEFSGRMPWEWNAQDVEEFISGPDQRLKSLSTMRHNHNAIKTFCAYLIDRKSTRLNSSHVAISYAVFCLKKKKKISDNDHNA